MANNQGWCRMGTFFSCHRTHRFWIALITSVLVVSCTKGPDCIIADQNGFLDSKKLEDKTYYLYYMISGFQEKTVFLMLYDREPAFDSCGQPDVDSVYGIAVEPLPPEGFINKVQLVQRENSTSSFLRLSYTQNRSDAYGSYTDIRISD